MIPRRMILAGASAFLSTSAFARSTRHQKTLGYQHFIASVRREAFTAGVRASVVDDAFDGLVAPNQDVIARDRNQPEYTMTWSDYRSKIITNARMASARQNYLSNQGVLQLISNTYHVDPGVIVAIWGIESSFGKETGRFNVIDALASLAYEGRRRTYFRYELIAALKILDRSGFPAAKMRGSYAGAMGQPQFMPSAYLRYAVDADGDNYPDIWTSQRDIFASVANFLAHSGWRFHEPWGYEIALRQPLPTQLIGRSYRAPDTQWVAKGVTRVDGHALAPLGLDASILQPDGPRVTGPQQRFMVYNNFNAIRHYNPSDFYALGVGLISDAATRA